VCSQEVTPRLAVRLRHGRRKRPDELLADRGYDAEHIRVSLCERGIEPRIVKKTPAR
jgi:hypothetical protein